MSMRELAMVVRIVFGTLLVGSAALVAWLRPRLAPVLFLELALYGLFVSIVMRCPRCGTIIYKRRSTIAEVEVTFWGGVGLPRHCAKCGLDFAKTTRFGEPLE